jgi:hypothetical protein
MLLDAVLERLHLSISGWIYEVTSPRYALRCFATPVEARSPPINSYYIVDFIYGRCEKFQGRVIKVTKSSG